MVFINEQGAGHRQRDEWGIDKVAKRGLNIFVHFLACHLSVRWYACRYGDVDK